MNKKRLFIIIGIVVVVVALVIAFDTMLGNHRLAIISLEAEPDIVTPLGSCQIVCIASNPDGNELSYTWSASGGTISGEGDTVTWTAPYRPLGYYNITVTVTNSRGGEAIRTITIEVKTNNPPTITSMTADAIWTLPSGSVQVACNVSDPDGDELSYDWSTSGGSISGTGSEVTWTAPEQISVYNITVVVQDGYGGSDMRTQPISVVTGQPPIIEDMAITADHCYLKTNTSPYKVGQGKKYDIQCIVSDLGIEVSYNWSCDGGEISGGGSMITWTAPNTSGKFTVTVVVSDIAGNLASKNLVLSVVECSWCTFRC